MNPYQCAVVLRPRGPGESVDLGLRVMQAYGVELGRLSLGVLGPWAAIGVLMAALGFGAWALGMVLLVSPWLQAPFTVWVAMRLFGQPLGGRELVGALWERRGAMAWLGFWHLTGLMMSACTLLFGGPVLLVVLLLLPEVLLLERAPGGAAWARALSLAGRSAGDAFFGALALVGLVLWALVTAEGVGYGVVSGVFQLGTPFGSLLDGDVTPYLVLGAVAVQVPIAVVRLLVYVGVRTVAEGWDLQVALRAVVEEAGP